MTSFILEVAAARAAPHPEPPPHWGTSAEVSHNRGTVLPGHNHMEMWRGSWYEHRDFNLSAAIQLSLLIQPGLWGQGCAEGTRVYLTTRHCGAWLLPQGLTVILRGCFWRDEVLPPGTGHQVSADTWGPALRCSFPNYTLPAFLEAPNSQLLPVSAGMDLIHLLVLCLGFRVRVMLITH